MTLAPTIPTDAFERALFATLACFDLRAHPLTADDLHAFLVWYRIPRETSLINVNAGVTKGVIRRADGHCFLNDRTDEVVARRRRRENHARRLWRTTRLSTTVIKRCPFVRGVATFGELSKGSTDRASDDGFLFLAAPGRVWIVRAMLTIFKRTVLPLDRIDEALRRTMQRVWERRCPHIDQATRDRIFRSTRQDSRACVGSYEQKILAGYSPNLRAHGIPA